MARESAVSQREQEKQEWRDKTLAEEKKVESRENAEIAPLNAATLRTKEEEQKLDKHLIT